MPFVKVSSAALSGLPRVTYCSASADIEAAAVDAEVAAVLAGAAVVVVGAADFDPPEHAGTAKPTTIATAKAAILIGCY
jgi:hypothetical protein